MENQENSHTLGERDNQRMCEVIKNLFFGGLNATKDENTKVFNNRFSNLNVSSCKSRSKTLLPTSENYKRIDLKDSFDRDEKILKLFANKLEEAIEFIKKELVGDQNVLVNCREGLRRSPMIIVGYLMKYGGMEYQEALELVQKSALRERDADVTTGYFSEVLEQYDYVEMKWGSKSASSTPKIKKQKNPGN